MQIGLKFWPEVKMDRPPLQLQPSEKLSGSKRTVMPRLRMDITDKTQPVDSRVVMKSSGVSSKTKQDNDGKEDVPSILPPSSEAYEKYLTEMEFKIRYMKNDIEYKQEQIKKRAKLDANLTRINNQLSHQSRGGLLKGSRKLVHTSLKGDNSQSVQKKSLPHSFQPTGYEKHSKSNPLKVLHQSDKTRQRPYFNSTKVEPIKRSPTHLIADSQSAHTSSSVASSSSSSSSSAPFHPKVISTSVPVNSIPVNSKASSSFNPAVSTHVIYPTQPQTTGVSSSALDHSKAFLPSAPHQSRIVLPASLSQSKTASSIANSKIVSTSVLVNPQVVFSSVHVNSRIVSPSASCQKHSHVVPSSVPVNSSAKSSFSVKSREGSTSGLVKSREGCISAPVNSRDGCVIAPSSSRQSSVSTHIISRETSLPTPVSSTQVLVISKEASTSAPINSRKVSTISTVNSRAVSTSVLSDSSVYSVAKLSQSKAINTQSSMQTLASRSSVPKFTSPPPGSQKNERKVIVLWKRGAQNEFGTESKSQKSETLKNITLHNNIKQGPTTPISGLELSSKLAYALPTSSAPNSPSKYEYVAPISLKSTRKGHSSPSSQLQVSPGLVTSQKSPVFDTDQTVPITIVKRVPTINRQKSCETKPVKKITPLKLRTAAKLVSKYKWKRPSPTSVSKMAPSFCTPGKLFAGYSRKEKVLPDDSSSKSKKVNRFKIDKRKLISTPLRSKSCAFTALPKNIIPQQSNGLTSISSFERKSKSRYSLQVTPQRGVKSCSKQEGSYRTKHQWVSVDKRTKDLKKSLSAKRHSALSRFRWKSSKAATTGQPLTPGSSRFKWSLNPASQDKKKFFQMQLRRHFGSGPPKSSTRVPFTSHHLQKSTKLVMIGGVVYRSSPRSLMRAVQLKRKDGKLLHQNLIQCKRKSIVFGNLKPRNVKLIHVRGIPYHLDAGGKKLCRAFGSSAKKGIPTVSAVAGASLKSTKLSFERAKDIQKKTAASRVLHRSLAYVAAKHKKDNRMKKQKQRYCMFFRRFGKCHRGNSCPYVHDPDKVVVCTRFLRGKCDVKNCLFSHDASVHKMPVCLYYLQGLCSREDCMYLHVNVSPNAPPCKDFLQGFCSLGKKCKKLHSFLCPSFAVFGKCSKGDKCTLLHRHSKRSPVAYPSINSKSKSSNAKVEGQSSTELLPVVPSHNESAGSSSHLLEEESSNNMQTGKPSPLKSQPAFISLLPLKPSDVLKVKGVASDAESSRERKPKIKPEFSRLDETVTMPQGSGSTEDVLERTESTNSQGVVSNMKDADEVPPSGFIHLSSSLTSDFTGESLHPSAEDGSLELSSTPQISPQKKIGPNQENQSNLKIVSPKAVLFKGIIPNFLPLSVPIRKAPGSQ